MILTIKQEREAELILLSKTLEMDYLTLHKFLLDNGVSLEEYNYLKDKYKHLLEKYYAEKLSDGEE